MLLDWLGWVKQETLDDLLARKQYDKAIEVLKAELKKRPRDRRLRLQLADALAVSARRREALGVLQGLAEDLSREGHGAQAVAVLKKIQALDPAAAAALDARITAALQAPPPPPAPPPTPAPAAAPPPPAEPQKEAEKPAPAAPAEVTPVAPAAEARSGLGDIALFRELSREELTAFISGLKLLVYEAGQIVVTEGEKGDSLFVVSAGRLRAFVKDRQGQSVQVSELGPGEFFGEMALLTGRKRSATLTVAERCELLQLDKPALAAISETHPGVRGVLREFYVQREARAAEVRGRKPRAAPALKPRGGGKAAGPRKPRAKKAAAGPA